MEYEEGNENCLIDVAPADGLICIVIGSLNADNKMVTTSQLRIFPEQAYILARRLTLAAMCIEDGAA